MDSIDWLKKADADLNQGRYKEAIQNYEKILETNPDNVGAWINKGVALFSLRKYEEALQANRRVRLL
ncbi:MAG: tetratricopeptide repeat protein [Candidatus Methanofastidiosia archaeon]